MVGKRGEARLAFYLTMDQGVHTIITTTLDPKEVHQKNNKLNKMGTQQVFLSALNKKNGAFCSYHYR